MPGPDLNAAWARALLSEWVRAGARDAVVCPGSRSSPLAVGAAELEGLRVWSVVDERSAAFFALGLARASGRPTLVVATSGSAGAHFLPAAIEAQLSSIPLVLLTADRPWELHDFGAPQTIPQEGLYGRFVRAAHALPVPEATDTAFLHLRALVSRTAQAVARAPGPVHFNVPFREPLAPTGGSPPDLGTRALEGEGPQPFVAFAARQPAAHVLSELTALVQHKPRGVIVCGPRAPERGFAEALFELSRAAGYPLLAEACSNARFGAPPDVCVVGHYEALLAHEPFARAHLPEVVLRFGGGLTSKRLGQWLDASGAHEVLFADGDAVIDPSHRARCVVPGGALDAARALAAHSCDRADGWTRRFAHAEQRAQAALSSAFAQDRSLTEPRIARELAASLPPHAELFVSSSMPIRELDAFAAPGRAPLRVHANRGANGIDGIVSTAAGVAASTGRPTVLYTGDLALLHDLGGLLLARRHALSLAIVVVNNDGGGIFSFLPIASATPHFEALFGTPHGLDLRHAAALAGARYDAPESPAALRDALALGLEGGLHLIEVKVPRAQNPGVHRDLWSGVAAALAEGPMS
jgi:2-succinyl-5-enolpyruvyl-6-hydroxy-3-cyclohexene-1-carboxylate synthase